MKNKAVRFVKAAVHTRGLGSQLHGWQQQIQAVGVTAAAYIKGLPR